MSFGSRNDDLSLTSPAGLGAVFACYSSFMGRVLLGLLKGGVVGALIGAGAFKLGIGGGFLGTVTYAIVGALTGILCGRPFWRQDTVWTTALKGIFGAVVGGALYWGAGKLFGGVHVAFAAKLGVPDRPFVELPVLMGPLIGAAWGAFVELDDGGSSAAAKTKPGSAKPTKTPPK
jgi:hypothetical protein